jgi:fermentation-respiration switch protein FrsA (DUF1100 family)
MQRQNKLNIIIFLILVFFTSGCVSDAIYHPTRKVRSTPADVKLTYEDVTIETSDGVKISGWWVPAEKPRGTVLFCHGNAGNIGDRLDTLVIINTLRLNVLIFDYRGYGNSNSSPSEKGTYLDADAAWDYLVNEKKISAKQIIIWGRSIGGAVAARTAAKHSAGLVIVESTFTSLKDLVNDLFVWVPSWILANYSYDTTYHLLNVSVPVLVIHSADDEIIPFQHGKNLYDSINAPKAFLEIKGSHNHGFIDSLGVYVSSINDFIRHYLNEKETLSK